MGEDLTEGSVSRVIVATALPMVFAFLLQSSFNVVDAFFVGRLGPEALAAVSVSFPIVFLTISVGTGIGVGATSVVARFIGAKAYRQADNAAEHALLSAAVVGVAMTALGLAASPALFDSMGAEGQVKEMGLAYIDIILWFNVASLLAMVASGILRGEGDMRTPMYVMGASAAANAVLDPLFIFTFGWGVAGAAWATVLTQTAGLAWFARHMLGGKSWVRLRPRDFVFEIRHIRGVFAVGIPSSLANIVMSVGMFFFTAIVGGFGPEALAAFGIGFRLDSLAILPAVGVSVALVSIVGQCVGAGQYERARKATLQAGFMASAFMVLVGGLFFAFAPELIRVFNADPEVVEYGTSFLRILPLSYLVVGFSICFSGAFLGSGKASLSLILTVLRVIAFSAPLAYAFSLWWGIAGVWAGILCGSYLGFLSGVVLFYFGGWDRPTH